MKQSKYKEAVIESIREEAKTVSEIRKETGFGYIAIYTTLKALRKRKLIGVYDKSGNAREFGADEGKGVKYRLYKRPARDEKGRFLPKPGVNEPKVDEPREMAESETVVN